MKRQVCVVTAVVMAATLWSATALAKDGAQPKGNPFDGLQTQVDDLRADVDSFFDIFTELSNHFQVDSFFDVFFDIDTRIDENTANVDSFFDVFTEVSALYGVDSFFDVFTEIQANRQKLKLLLMQKMTNIDTKFDFQLKKLGSNVDSFFDIFTEVSALYGVDSFFDVFTEIQANRQKLKLLLLQKMTNIDTKFDFQLKKVGSNIDSVFDIFTEIEAHYGVDSFFDVFFDIDVRLAQVRAENKVLSAKLSTVSTKHAADIQVLSARLDKLEKALATCQCTNL